MKNRTAHYRHPQGDNVRGDCGQDAGKSGRVLSIDAKKNRVVVEHVAVMKRPHPPQSAKKYQRRHPSKRGLHQRSNVMVVVRQLRQTHSHRPQRFTGWHKVRSCRRCNTALDK